MCLVCEAFHRVNDRFEVLQGTEGAVATSFGGDEESLAQVLAFVFYGHDMTQHERDQAFKRSMHAGTLFMLALVAGDGTPVDMVGSSYLVGFAHGMKFHELKGKR